MSSTAKAISDAPIGHSSTVQTPSARAHLTACRRGQHHGLLFSRPRTIYFGKSFTADARCFLSFQSSLSTFASPVDVRAPFDPAIVTASRLPFADRTFRTFPSIAPLEEEGPCTSGFPRSRVGRRESLAGLETEKFKRSGVWVCEAT